VSGAVGGDEIGMHSDEGIGDMDVGENGNGELYCLFSVLFRGTVLSESSKKDES
jgi:hypothetical protein